MVYPDNKKGRRRGLQTPRKYDIYRMTKGLKKMTYKNGTTNKKRKNIHFHCNDNEVVVLSCCTTDIKYSIHNN